MASHYGHVLLLKASTNLDAVIINLLKCFFGFSKYHSVTAVLIDLKLPSFNTIMHNLRYVYSTHWWSSGNMLIVNLRNIGIVPYV